MGDRELQGDATTRMEEGQMVEIEVDAIPGVRFEGRVASISEATGSFFCTDPAG